MSMDIDTQNDTITIDGTAYDIEREHDRDGMGETFTVVGMDDIEARLRHDDDYDSTMALDYCRVGHMIIVHRGYTLGDEHTEPDTEIECERCEGNGEDPERTDLWRQSPGWAWSKIGTGTFESMQSEQGILQRLHRDKNYDVNPSPCLACKGDGRVAVSLLEWAKREHGATMVLPIYMYEHSGITISAGGPLGSGRSSAPGYPYTDQWDAGVCGIIFDTAKGREETGVPADKIEEALRGEIEEYDKYLRGEVYFFTVDAPGYTDGCGGFVGYDHAERELFESIHGAIEASLREREEAAAMAARDIITVSA